MSDKPFFMVNPLHPIGVAEKSVQEWDPVTRFRYEYGHLVPVSTGKEIQPGIEDLKKQLEQLKSMAQLDEMKRNASNLRINEDQIAAVMGTPTKQAPPPQPTPMVSVEMFDAVMKANDELIEQNRQLLAMVHVLQMKLFDLDGKEPADR